MIAASPGSGAVHSKVIDRAWTQEVRKSLTASGTSANNYDVYNIEFTRY